METFLENKNSQAMYSYLVGLYLGVEITECLNDALLMEKNPSPVGYSCVEFILAIYDKDLEEALEIAPMYLSEDLIFLAKEAAAFNSQFIGLKHIDSIIYPQDNRNRTIDLRDFSLFETDWMKHSPTTTQVDSQRQNIDLSSLSRNFS